MLDVTPIPKRKLLEPANYIFMSPYHRRLMRNEYAFEQGGLCYHCKEPLNKNPQRKKPINWALFPPNFLAHPVHLHHSHKTGMTIGAVHAYCNAELWQYHGE